MTTRREILEAVRAGAMTPEAAYAQIAALAKEGGSGGADQADRTDPMERTDRSHGADAAGDGIAVIGMAGRFPGAADVGEYWRNLCEGRDSVGEVPPARWDHAAYYSADSKAPGKCATKWGGFLADADKFDPLFFNLSPREAERMDPQQRLFLQEAWKAFEDAGCADERLQALKCGVFVGCKDGDYRDRLRAGGTDAYGLMGNDSAILSARIAYHLNLHGPAISVDTACSSSAVALHLACESLRSGACELALAGGAVLMTSPESFVTLSRLNAFSATGRCRAFAAGADGFVPAEAVAAVVLKPLAAARRDGDRIYGVIRGTAVNQDGRSNGITAPSAPAQTALIRELYDRLKLDPTTIGYIETHGTGTALGDPIEVEGLTRAFRHYTERRGFCALGAVKSNTGHPMLASGVSALIKVLLCLRHRELVPSLHFDAPNPHIDFEGSPFFVNTRRQAWAVPAGGLRRAGLSSFGFSGTNVHLVVEEAEGVEKDGKDLTDRTNGTDRTDLTSRVRLYAFSGKTTEALLRRAAELAAWLRGPEGAAASAADIAWTLGAGRTHLAERAAVVAKSKAELLGVLDRVLAEGVDSAAWRRGAPAPENERGELTARAEALAADGRTLRAGEARETLEALATLYGRGASLPWRTVTAGGRTISLPAYPFARERHWIEWPARKTETEDKTYGANGKDGTDRATVGGELNFYTTRWEPVEGRPAVPEREPGAVVWRWSGGAGSVAERVRAAAEAARGLVARIAAERPGTTRRLVVLAESATPAADPVADFLGGWVRSLRMVLPRVAAILVRTTPEDAASAEGWAVKKTFNREDDPKGREEEDQPGSFRAGAGLAELRCEGGQTWRRVAERIAIPEGEAVLRRGGVYAITGGLGGVGRRVARHLLERYQARLLLIGRSEAGTERLAELSRQGGEVIYRRADLTRPAELQAALAEARARFGLLHGVIHTAGVATSESVLERSDENLAAVLGPKVAGTLALHAATAADDLDFFAVFSSTAAVLGDFGQCDYAGANAFLDGFAAWREGERAAGRAQGRTVSFGWPLWREGGMHFGGATEREYLRTSGLAYLETGDGLAALERGLAARMAHVVVMPGDTGRADRALGLGGGAEKAESGDRACRTDRTDRTYDGTEEVKAGVLAAVARVLKLDAARVDVNRGLGEYGFDSINLKELADELAGDFGVEVSPAVFFARNTVAALTEHLVTRGVKARVAAGAAEAAGAGDRTNAADKTDRTEDAGRSEPIAVIGLAGVFPGAADAREFWANLVAGKDSIREVPAERWDWREYFEAGATGEGPRAASKWGGFIEGADRFDARFFNLSPLEAQLMDPQQRLFLQTAWHALEDAAVAPSSLAGRRVGVFAGAQFNDYDDLLALAGERRPQRVTGCAHSVLANRVSYWLNLRGPSEAIDTACSSGLVAVNRAVRALRVGECELALAGAVCLILSPENMVGASKLGVLSPDGRCRTFGKGANGFVKGEGVGVLVLKPLSRAMADGDPVHAVIRASGVNHGGRAHSLTAPNPVAQAELVETVYREAGVPVESVGYVEAHGTGTELGDPTEVEGLRTAFAALADPRGPAAAGWCGLGSVKTNIGHLEPAAGIAGIMKVIFALRHGVLPASLHAAEPNPFLKLEGSPFAVVRETREWVRARKADGGEWPRRAGVSAFGFGGANGHVLLEEYVGRAEKDRTDRTDGTDLTKGAAQVIVLSARNEERLRATGRRLAAYLRANAGRPGAPGLAEVAYTLQVGRDAMEARWATAAASVEDAVERIEGWLAGGANGKGTNKADGKNGTYGSEETRMSAWLRGEAVDWRAAWPGRAPRRVSLPGYAFAEDRHWFTAALRKETPKAELGAVGGETKETVAVPATDWLLCDHRVAGVPTLPAAGSLALACQAGAGRLGGRVEELCDMVWLERAQAAGERALELTLRVTTSEAATARFEMTAGGAGTPRYAEGRAQAKAEAGAAPRLDLAAIRARCGGRLDGAAAYAGLEARGMSFGPAFRTLKEIAAGQGEALATLALPAEACGWAGEVNPALLDGALQAIAGVAAKTESAETLLPFSLGRLRIWGSATSAAVAHVVERPAAGTGLRKFDIGVASADGTVFWELRDLAVRIQKTDSRPVPDEAVTLEFFERRWLPAPASPVRAGGWLTVLALDEDAALAELLGRHVAVRRVVRVRTGRSFAQLGWELYAVRPDAPEDWRALYRALNPKPGEHWGVVNAWGAGKGFVPSAAALRPQVRKALYPCVGWAQAWLGGAARPTLRWVQLAASDEMRPAQAAMTGVLATLAQEQPAFSGCVLERSGTDLLETVATRCVAEWSPGGAGGGRVRYADGVRTVERFAATAGPAASGGLAASLRPGGVYVLAGGLGGIGRALTRVFAATAGARLVVLGRGADGVEARERLRELRDAGAEVLACAVDLADGPAVAVALARAREKFGALHGVVQCAGVTRDRLVQAKTGDDLDAVLAPKVDGTVWLDAATRGDALDFFVVCSSMAGVTGNVGQADYAYANAFLDNWAEWRRGEVAAGRRSGKTLSVAWPLWAEGGMKVEPRAAAWMREKFGLVPLPTEMGLRVLADALAADAGQVVLLAKAAGGPAAANAQAGGDARAEEKAQAKAKKAEDGAYRSYEGKSGGGAGADRLEAYLKAVLAKETGLAEADIEAGAALERYGIDSLLAMGLTRALERDFGELPKTLFFEYQTLAALAAYLRREHPATVARVAGGAGGGDQADRSDRTDRTDQADRTDRTDLKDGIAIVGLSGRFPMAEDIDALWANLKAGKDCITEIPAERWDWRVDFDPVRGREGKTYSKWGGFLDDADKFDSLFFSIAPREAETMDPQERIFLEEVWKTLENAGYARSALAGRKVGVFVGVMYNQYQLFAAEEALKGNPVALGSSASSIANRVSYVFDWHGPSLALDTMCSSSLTALHLACESLRRGEVEAAVAGGVNLSIHPQKYLQLGFGEFASSDGRCRSFGEGGDGYVPGEGVGAVLLKPLARAVADGDRILGLIRGSAVNHGGKTNGYSVPNPVAQGEVVADALRAAGVNARELSYVEAHGTGTALGDPIEVAGLVRAFGHDTAERGFCALGSVKSNLGHLESAAGMAGLAKVLLQMEHGELAPTIHAEPANPNIRFPDTPFVVQTRMAPWARPAGGGKRVAGISSFGAGGANAHVIVEEWTEMEEADRADRTDLRGEEAVVISAFDEERLREVAGRLAAFLDGAGAGLRWRDVAFTLQVGRTPLPERLGLVAKSAAEAAALLRGWLEGKGAGVTQGNAKRRGAALVAGPAGARYVAALWTDGDLATLVRLWTAGAEIDWVELRRGAAARRVALPAYPFKRVRHWVPGRREGGGAALAASGGGRLHPLVHRNESDFREQRFVTNLDEAEPVLADHRVLGGTWLSAVAMLEMARWAAERAGGRPVTQLYDLVWERAVAAPDAAHLALVLGPTEDGAAFVLRDARDETRRFAGGRTSVAPAAAAAALNLAEIEARCPRLTSGAELYAECARHGVEYGAFYRSIEGLRVGEGEALAWLGRPSGPDAAAGLDLSMLDGALQSVGALLRSGSTDAGPFVPFALERVELHAAMPARAAVAVRRAAGVARGSSIQKFDLTIANPEGTVCVMLKGLALRMATPVVADNKAGAAALEAVRPERLTGPAGGGAEAKAKDNAAPLEDGGRGAVGVYLRGLVAVALKVEPARIAGGEPLDSYGFDSVLMMRLTRELERDFGALPKTLFFEHRSLDELAGYFAAEHGARVAERFGVRAAAPAPVPPGTVAPVRATLPGLRRETLTRAGAGKGSGAPAAGAAIAIVGLAGRYPEADTLEEFWANLRAGRDSIAEVPAERWDHAAIFDPTPGKPGKTYSKWGGWVRDADKFDPLFFAIAPREAEFMDPQERLFLQTAWHSCEDAGLTRAKLAGRKAGVFVGVMYGHYQLMEPDAAGVPPGTSFASIANRVSYFLDLQGPSLAVDTMCSSSLTAIHLACESLRRGESELAIAGGVNLTLHPNKYLQLSHGRFASTDGRCRAFGAEGDGYVPGEGVGAVVLKPLAQAETDGDPIYGVLRATTTNHGGRTNGYSVPNPAAQARVVGEALAAAGVDPADISYVEAHGTGTALGDPVEIRGLTKAFEMAGPGWRCALGSVKSNIGHLESAAGMAALTKVLLQMRHRELVPSLHAEALNPHIDFAKTPFVVQRELAPWKSTALGVDGREGERPRMAGISSFGAGGANAHLIVEEWVGAEAEDRTDRADRTNRTDLEDARVVVISTRNAKALRPLVEAWVEFLAKTRAPLAGIAASSQLRREPMAERLAVCARTVAELRTALAAWLAGGEAGPVEGAEIFAGRVQAGAAPAAGALVSGEEGAAFLRAVIAQRNAAKLAQLWTGGVSIDWSLLYLDEPAPAPVRLPLYVFARDRYWLGADGVRVRAAEGAGGGSDRSDLADRTYAKEPLKAEVVAAGEEGASVRIAVGAERGFVRDHLVGGRRLLPGVACLELVRRALAAAWPGAAAGEWRHLVWAAPLEVPDAGVDLWIELRRKPGRWEFTLETRAMGGGRTVHVQGRVAERSAAAGAMRLDIEALRARCAERLEGEEVYGRFAEIGFAYGPAMRAVEFIQAGPGEALARLAAAPEAGIEWTPALLDGALQAVLGTTRTGAGADGGRARAYLPFSAGEVWLASGALPARAWAHIVAGTEDANTRRYQIAVCDDAGEVRVRLKDFAVRAAAARSGETAVPENGAGPGPEVAAYVPEWVEQALPEAPEGGGARKVVLVASEDEVWLDAARRAGAAAVRLPADEAAWATAVAAAAETWGMRVSQVILDGRGEEALRPEWVAAAKALLRARGPMHLTIAGRAGDGEAVAGLGGFARTVQAEAPTLRVTLLGLVEPTVETVLAAARAEADAPAADLETRRDAAGLRRVRRWREASWPSAVAAWRAGTYLITGGAGGLGRIFATEATRWPGVRVVLVGRSPENEDIAAWLRGLRAGGAQIEYRSCDLTRSEAVTSLVRALRTEGAPIRGVVHAAGVLRDRLLAQKGWADFEAVLAPKAAGARNLDEALADEELDFFAVFSSTAGALGNPGQADYAAANGALDAFARLRASDAAAGRRQGRTVSFNWPYWREGGMRIEARMLGWIEQETGLRPLETSAGLAAFAAGLAGTEPQVLVLAGDQPRIRKALGLAERRPEAAKSARPVAPEAKAEIGATKTSPAKETAAELVARVERELAGMTADLLKVPVAELDPQVELGEYGMDSIAMMTMLNRIEALHDCTLDPNVIASQGTLGRLARHLVETGAVRAEHAEERNLTDLADRTNLIERTEGAERRAPAAVMAEPVPVADGRIAVVAMACRFPRSPSLEAYWENLREGRNLISEIPPDRWDVERFYSADKKAPQRAYSKWGGFMDGVDLFDAKYFGVSEQDAALMDPQQRHLLELTQELFDRAGYRRAELDGTRTGVFVGGGQSAYLAESRRIPESHMKHRVVGMIQNMMAARVADFFNLKGPAQTIDTACSSSLVALHFACQSLLAGDCELAVVGGAELLIDPYQFVGFSKAEVLSDDGQCYVFDERAKGIVLGEGAGVVLLKPYARAVADGDIICGVIRGSAINNDGRTMGLTVPSQEGQKDVIRRALEKSGVSAATIGYLEAHGTGTLLGDPIEIRAATQVFAEAGAGRQVCAVGSVKSNMGHLVRAAGIASFIKVMLALWHRTIPATINCARPHPRFKFGESPFYPVTATRPWAELAGVRRAGISSFGFGGTNCHVVVEEHLEAPEKPGLADVIKGKDLAGAAGLERELNALSQ